MNCHSLKQQETNKTLFYLDLLAGSGYGHGAVACVLSAAGAHRCMILLAEFLQGLVVFPAEVTGAIRGASPG